MRAHDIVGWVSKDRGTLRYGIWLNRVSSCGNHTLAQSICATHTQTIGENYWFAVPKELMCNVHVGN